MMDSIRVPALAFPRSVEVSANIRRDKLGKVAEQTARFERSLTSFTDLEFSVRVVVPQEGARAKRSAFFLCKSGGL
jgi:hypothetical protein